MEKCRRLLLGYGVLTCLSLIFDFVELIIHYVRFGYPGSEHSDLTMLFLTLIFLGLDVFYIVWAFQAKSKFPGHVAVNISSALFGQVEKFNLEILRTVNGVDSRSSRFVGRFIGNRN